MSVPENACKLSDGQGCFKEDQPRTVTSKFIIVTGGTMSGLGKGTTISSMGVCLKARGLHVTMVKIDPYLNIDAGTMSPFEHGECYVLADGTETDLDLGNYERFLNLSLCSKNIITAGRLYNEVLQAERKGSYLGKTVQIVPHLTDHLESMLLSVSNTKYDGKYPDVVMVEVGGTVGDLESAVFLESISRMRAKIGNDNVIICHLGYVPILYGEQKTKPTQSSIRQLRLAGLNPDFILCRCQETVGTDSLRKIATHSNMPVVNVISCHDVSNIYRLSPVLERSGIIDRILKVFDDLPLLSRNTSFRLKDWEELAERVDKPKELKLNVVIAGKYTGQTDTYISVIKAVTHAAIEAEVAVDIVWLNCEEDKEKAIPVLDKADCIIIPGGFGNRGIGGKVYVAKYCREKGIPLLGLCLGLQIMIIEYMRNVLGYAKATSEEFDPDSEVHAVVYMPETRCKENLGGTMILGERKTILKKGSIISSLYGGAEAHYERHRHRYEVNPKYIKEIEANKELVFSGSCEENERMHVVEAANSYHPYYIGLQSHPEFQSRPLQTSPVFVGLIQAAITRRDVKKRGTS